MELGKLTVGRFADGEANIRVTIKKIDKY